MATSISNQINLQYPIAGLSVILPDYPYEDNCGRFWPTFNATGTYSLGPSIINEQWPVGGNATENLSWTVAVGQYWNDTVNGTGTQTMGWLSTPAGIDLTASDLPYSGCAFFMGGLTNNTIYRGQTDTGDCSATFTSDCTKALINQTETLALQIANADITESSLSTTGLLPEICLQIEQGLSAKGAVPKECADFVGNNMTWSDGALSETNMQFVYTEITGPNSTISETCSVNSSATDINYQTAPITPDSTLSLIGQSNVWIYNLTAAEEAQLIAQNQSVAYNYESAYNEVYYQNGTTWVYPIITLFFPPANTSKLGYAAANNHTLSAQAFMTCARPVNVTDGSRIPSPLPSPTPFPKAPLSKGAKAGIAIGVVLFVALIASLIAFLLWQRKKKRVVRAKTAEQERQILEEKKAREEEEELKEARSPMLDSEPIGRFELTQDDRKPEIQSTEMFEMEGSPVAELKGNTIDQELEGTKSGQSLSLEEW